MTQLALDTGDSGAEIDGGFRYRLWRRWGIGLPCLWVMLNPSTATAVDDDPTVRKCCGFARRWGFDGIEIVNLFAWRTPYPQALVDLGDDAIGPRNDETIRAALQRARAGVVVAWGDLGSPLLRVRARAVERMMRELGAAPLRLGTTKAGHPRHPARIAYATLLEPHNYSIVMA